jgi:hypothetical protein
MRTPAKVFTDWGREVVALPVPISGISATRLEALLESIMLERSWPSELDSEAIEAVLAALQSDDLIKVKTSWPGRSRSAKVAVSTIASLASVSTGAAAAGALAGPVEGVAASVLDPAAAAVAAPKDHEHGGVDPAAVVDGAAENSA